MLTVSEFAKTLTRRGVKTKKKTGVTRQHVLKMLKDARIPGAMRVGDKTGLRGMWLIPENAQVIELSNEKNKNK